MTKNNVYIRGWGAVTALGWSAEESAKKLITGLVPPAAYCLSSHLITNKYKAFEVPYSGNAMEKSRLMLDSAFQEAVDSADLSSEDVADSSLFVGTTGGFFIRNEYEFTEAVRADPEKESQIIVGRNRGPGEVSDWIARKYGIKGMVMTFGMACVSSSHALVVAARLLEQKKINRAIVVGYEPLLNFTLHGFASLLLYDDEQCRPFCNKRAGIQLGEGAAAIILERNEKSQAGKTQYKFAGGYLFNDTKSLTSAGVDGELVKDVILHTLNKAEISNEEVVAIKAHGTGSGDNDLSEGRGLIKLFGEKLPPVVSLKGAFGHTIGAAGTVEAAVLLSCCEAGIIPRTVGFEEIDPEIGFAPTTTNTPAKDGAYLFTCFGFGGACTSCLIIKNNGTN